MYIYLCFSGPGFNLFLRELHFYIGPFLVDKYTSPGVGRAVEYVQTSTIVTIITTVGWLNQLVPECSAM